MNGTGPLAQQKSEAAGPAGISIPYEQYVLCDTGIAPIVVLDADGNQR